MASPRNAREGEIGKIANGGNTEYREAQQFVRGSTAQSNGHVDGTPPSDGDPEPVEELSNVASTSGERPEDPDRRHGPRSPPSSADETVRSRRGHVDVVLLQLLG